PTSHENPLSCGCPVCIPKGSIKSSALRRKLDPPPPKRSYADVLKSLHEATAKDDICSLLMDLSSRIKRKSSSADIDFLLEHPSPEVQEELAILLEFYEDAGAKQKFLDLKQWREK